MQQNWTDTLYTTALPLWWTPNGIVTSEWTEEMKCKNCGIEIRLINYALGEAWMHIERNASFPTQQKGTAWRYCKQTEAEPEEK